jgi:hypothetical protein
MSQSCDDLAPPGVISHGGNRTCTNGVCGRQLDYCTMPTVAQLLNTTDATSRPSGLNASGIAFERYGAKGSAGCTGYLSQYLGSGSPNYVHVVTPTGVVRTDPSTPTPGFMHGITVVHPTEAAQAAQGLTTFIATSTVSPNPGWVDLTVDSNVAVTLMSNLTPAPTLLQCTGATCPFTVPAFNFFPTAPGANGLSLQNKGVPAAGFAVYGNYAAQGDVFTIKYANDAAGAPGWRAAKLTANTTGDFNSAVAVGLSTTLASKSDGLVRIAHGARIDFYYVPKQTFVYSLVLNGNGGPYASPTASPPLGGAGRDWFAHGMRYVQAITGLSVDPLNQTNDTYAEVREARPTTAACGGNYTYMIQIRGDDYSVRPLDDYTDLNCVVVPGIYSTLGLSSANYVRPPMGKLAANGEGRITTDTISYLHRLIPLDPASSGVPKLNAYRLPP